MPQLKPYPRYKPSGIQWIGDIPEHWEVTALKRLCSFSSGAGFPIAQQGSQDLELPFFKVSDMNLAGNENVMTVWNNSVSRVTATELKASIFPPGTIIFPKVGGALLTNKRRVIYRPSCIDNNLMGCVVNRGDPRFILLLLKCIDLGIIAKPGALPAISEGEVREIRIPHPSLDEQRAIADYLDHQTQIMDSLVAKKRRMVELLAERRESIIIHTVTKGLDPRAPMRDSGIQWIGEIPEHWEVRRLKTCVQDVIQPSNGVAEDELCLALEHVESWTGKYKEAGPEERLVSQTKRFRPDDVLFGKLGPHLAKVARPNKGGICVGEFLVLRADLKSMIPNYLEQLIRSKPVIEAINSSTYGSIMPRTNWKFIGNMQQPLPPLPEQRAIADYLNHQTQIMDMLTEKLNRQIELLAERRQSLITHAVTGKIDVKESKL